MAIYHESVVKAVREDAKGNVTVDTAVVTRAIRKDAEPDYVKLYIDGWSESNKIPPRYRQIFLGLAMRMGYAKIKKGGDMDKGGQTVWVAGPDRKALLEECGWSGDDALRKGLRALVDCGAIRKISRGLYQINPRYAARGTWHYNSGKKQGGVENLLAVFEPEEQERTADESIVQAAAGDVGVEEEIGLVAEEIKALNGDVDVPF